MEIKIITPYGTHLVRGFMIADGQAVQLDDVSRMRLSSDEGLSFAVFNNAIYLELE